MNKAIYHAICLQVYEEVEALANQFNESQYNYVIEVELNHYKFHFILDINITNYVYEDDTNAVSYNTVIFCKNVVMKNDERTTQDFELHGALNLEFSSEILYKD